MTVQDPSGRWISSDGRLWWDGQQWRPTTPTPNTSSTEASGRAAMIVGLIGGITGLIAGLLALIGAPAMMAGWVEGAEGDMATAGFSWIFPVLAAVGIGASVIGIVGAAIAGSRPAVAASLMLAGGLGGLATVWFLYLVSGPLLLVGAFLSFRDFSHNRPKGPVLSG